MTPAEAVQFLKDERLEIHWDECWDVLKSINFPDPELARVLVDALACDSEPALLFAIEGLR